MRACGYCVGLTLLQDVLWQIVQVSRETISQNLQHCCSISVLSVSRPETARTTTEASTGSGDSVEWWVWLLVALAVLAIAIAAFATFRLLKR